MWIDRVSRAQRSMEREARNGVLQTRDPGLCQSNRGPGSAVHRFAPSGAARCTASGTQAIGNA
jgi:hypothetical protein